MPLVRCVPARRLDCCQCTTRAMMSARGTAPKIASGSSAVPALPLSSVLMSICMSVPSAIRRFGRRLDRGRSVSAGEQRRRIGRIRMARAS